MMKKILAFLLAGALTLTPALAATEDLFPAKNSYPGFADVPQDQWYSAAVQTCFEVGLMNGTGAGNFTPQGVMSVAEAATIAARIREAITGEAIALPTPQPGQTIPWYEGYVNYLTKAGVDLAPPKQQATRAQFFSYLAAVVPESELAPINAITALPDSQDAGVLRFYNAGILKGTDEYGTFQAAGSLSRAECATMVARIIRPDLRQRFTLQEKPAGPSFQEELEGTMAMMVNGDAVSMSEFVNAMDRFIFETDYQLYASTGKRLDWSADYGVGDLPTFFREQTKAGLTRDTLLAQQAAAMGCKVDDLAAALNPNPSQEVLSTYAQIHDYLAAKHILIQTSDPQGGQVYSDEQARTLAQQIIDALNATPTRQQFENLMALYNNDPGMTSYPEGYLFTKGEMVEEFETAVRALSIGAYTLEPVKSEYGYHIILRLDPATLTELKTEYQEKELDKLADAWVDSATVTVNDVMISQIDVKGCYETYFELLRQQAIQQQQQG